MYYNNEIKKKKQKRDRELDDAMQNGSSFDFNDIFDTSSAD